MNQFAQRHFRGLIVAIWLATSLFLAVMGRDAISAFKVGDPDDALRIVQVRDWLAGQSWWDVTQYRMNVPDGGPMHWSRLVDLPIAAAMLLFRPWLGQAGAEQAAAAIVPLLTYGIVLSFYAGATRRLWGASAALLAAGTFFLILPVIEQLLPMRIDHHGWQIAMFCIGLWTLFDPRQRLYSAAVLGLAMAMWMEISVEALPFALLFLGLIALRWLWPSPDTKSGAQQLLVTMTAFVGGMFALFAITERWGGTPDYCDSLSPFHLSTAVTIALVLAAGMALQQRRLLPQGLVTKLAIGGGSVLAGAAILFTLAPQCAGDAFATLDPLVRTYWFDRGAEGLPLWALPLNFTAQPLAGLAAGLIGCIWLWRGQRGQHGQSLAVKISLTLLFAGCALVGAAVSRTIIYALLVGHLMLVPLALSLFAKAAAMTGPLPRTGLRLAAIALLMSAIVGQNVLALRTPTSAASTSEIAKKQAFNALARACQSPDAARMLNSLPQSHIMAPLDSSPSVLLYTQHKVVATGHHRNAAAMADVIRTFIGSADQAREILAKRQIDIVLTCEGSFELSYYAERKPQGFAAQLQRGEVPDWLRRQADIGPFHVYRVQP